ncbi:MAG: preprotein translocase subunit SecG [Cyclobacteriaceae bacterium]
MYAFIIGLIIFFAVLLVLVILAQNAKGGGLTSQFGGSSASNIIGVKKTGDLLEKLTWSFIIAIMVLSLSTSFMTPNAEAPTNDILDRAGDQAPVNTTPDFDLDSTATEIIPADTAP